MKIVRPYNIVDATLVSCNVPETDYAAYNPATTYALGDRVIVIGTNIHKIYESLQAANVGHTPATEPTWWLDRGATNRWKMFDTLVNSQTEYATNIQFSLSIAGRINAIALLNLWATSVTIVATSPTEGVVFNRTVSMQSDLGTGNWWDYFFDYAVWDNSIWDSTLVITDIPVHPDLVIDVTISGIAGVTKCGACIVGMTKNIGLLQYGAGVGIQDYSIKTRDTWGNYTVMERAYNKRANFTLDIISSAVDNLLITLSNYRAIPILYIGDESYDSTIILGFYKDFSINIAYFSYSVCSIEIEGII